MIKKVSSIFLVFVLLSPLVFAKKIELTQDSVVYGTLNNLNSNLYRQAVILIDLQKKYKGKSSYTIKFGAKGSWYKTIYEPLNDKIRVHVTQSGQVVKKTVYIGLARERLVRVENERRSSFGFYDDIFSKEEDVNFYVAPGYEHLLEEELNKE
jgi:hypothetical protein